MVRHASRSLQCVDEKARRTAKVMTGIMVVFVLVMFALTVWIASGIDGKD